jgi:hypothetical protein
MTGLVSDPTGNPALVRPAPEEYKDYYQRYTVQVPDGDVLATLEAGERELQALLRPVPESRASDRYAPGKWSIKEVVGHMMDTERVMSFRALYIARGGSEPLAGFDQEVFADHARFDRRPLAGLLDEYGHLRQATLGLIRSFDAEAAVRRGTAWNHTVSVRALVWIIAGHERHHIAGLKEKYLN